MIVRYVAADDDLSALGAIHAACFADPWTAVGIAELLETPGTFAVAAEGAFILARVAAAEAEILTLAVLPRARRRGLGRTLVLEAAQEATRCGAERMFLEVAVSNAAARALYASFGFREVGRRKAYYTGVGGAEDAIVLRAPMPLSPL